MEKQTYIYIQEPCHENWNSMTSEEQGRFCHSCSKTVTDFSNMSDTAILKYLSTASGSTCGRFDNDQLNREIHIPATPAKKKFWAYLLSMVLPVLVADRLQAQKKSPEKTRTEQVVPKGLKTLPELPPIDRLEGDTTIPVSTAVASESSGEAHADRKHVTMGLIIQYDKVKVQDTIKTTVKKATGNELFRIYPNPATKGKKISIQVSKAGEYTLQLLDNDSKMIIVRTVTVTSKGQMVFLDIPQSIASGNYYLRLVQVGSGKQFVDKLVVK